MSQLFRGERADKPALDCSYLRRDLHLGFADVAKRDLSFSDHVLLDVAADQHGRERVGVLLEPTARRLEVPQSASLLTGFSARRSSALPTTDCGA